MSRLVRKPDMEGLQLATPDSVTGLKVCAAGGGRIFAAANICLCRPCVTTPLVFTLAACWRPAPDYRFPGLLAAWHVWTAALAPFYDSPKTLLSFLEADPAAAVHVLIAGRFSTFLTCDTAARRCAHCIDAGPSCNGRLGGRLAVLSACPPVRLACKSKTCLRVYSERRGHVCVPFRYKPAKTAGRCYCLCFTWTCVPRPWNPKARVGRHEFPRGLGRYFIFPR